MNTERGAALEAAFDAAFDALDKKHLEAVYSPKDGVLAIFNRTIQVGVAHSVVQAGELFAKVIKEHSV